MYNLLNIIKNLVAVRPEIKFSSDFIVGYPGETEKDFEDTLSLINNVKFVNSFSFIYNQRPGTPAFKLNPLSRKIIKKTISVKKKIFIYKSISL